MKTMKLTNGSKEFITKTDPQRITPAESEENMTIYEITEKIVESKNNDIAKAFAMHIGSLLINNGIVPIMKEYTRNDVKNIKDANEYKLVMEYGISFNELDCSKHDREVYNKAIDDFSNEIDKYIERYDGTIYDEAYYTNVKSDFEDLKKICNQLKACV